VTLYSQGLVFSSLIQELAAAGAPGAMVTGATGAKFNPVHELARGFSQAFVQATNAAIGGALWYSTPPTPPLPTPFPGPLPELLGAPAQVAILPAAVPALATAHATSLGWTGPASTVLFRGLYNGLSFATSSSGKLLTANPATTLTAVTGQIVQLHMPALPVVGLAGATLSNWSANPLLGVQGDPSRRIALATEWAKSANTCWMNIRPLLTLVGNPTGTNVGTHTLVVV
jgi:hypothetical protein